MQPTHPDQTNDAGVPAWRRAIVSHGIGSSGARRTPSAKVRRRILDQQQNRCLYCDFEFGSTVYQRSRALYVTLVWDHFAPFVYTQRSSDSEFVAACRTCNGIKTCTIYSDVEDARRAIQARRVEKGFPANAWDGRTATLGGSTGQPQPEPTPEPHPLRYEGMGNYQCQTCGAPTLGWPCPNGPDRVPMNPTTGMPA